MVLLPLAERPVNHTVATNLLQAGGAFFPGDIAVMPGDVRCDLFGHGEVCSFLPRTAAN